MLDTELSLDSSRDRSWCGRLCGRLFTCTSCDAKSLDSCTFGADDGTNDSPFDGAIDGELPIALLTAELKLLNGLWFDEEDDELDEEEEEELENVFGLKALGACGFRLAGKAPFQLTLWCSDAPPLSTEIICGCR